VTLIRSYPFLHKYNLSIEKEGDKNRWSRKTRNKNEKKKR